MIKLTEDETIIILIKHLEHIGWKIESTCMGQKHGNDIVASISDSTMIIEVKGARAGNNSPTKKREKFDSGQIKTHFGKAIVKVLDEKYLNPTISIAIAHPDDMDIRKSIGHLIPFLKPLSIKHFWVSPDSTVIEE